MRPVEEPAAGAAAREALANALAAVDQATGELHSADDPVLTARLATELIDGLTARRERVAAVRRDAVAALRPTHSYDELARVLGVSKSLIAFISREIRGRDPRYRRRRE